MKRITRLRPLPADHAGHAPDEEGQPWHFGMKVHVGVDAEPRNRAVGPRGSCRSWQAAFNDQCWRWLPLKHWTANDSHQSGSWSQPAVPAWESFWP